MAARKNTTSTPATSTVKDVEVIRTHDDNGIPFQEDRVVVGRVVNSTPDTRRQDAQRFITESVKSGVSLARVLSEIVINEDWDEFDQDESDYVAELGIGAAFTLPRSARVELGSLVTSAGVDFPKAKFALWTGASPATAARDMREIKGEDRTPSMVTDGTEETGEEPEGSDGTDDKPVKSDAEKAADTLATLSKIAAKLSDEEKAALVKDLKVLVADLV